MEKWGEENLKKNTSQSNNEFTFLFLIFFSFAHPFIQPAKNSIDLDCRVLYELWSFVADCASTKLHWNDCKQIHFQFFPFTRMCSAVHTILHILANTQLTMSNDGRRHNPCEWHIQYAYIGLWLWVTAK